MMTHDQLDAKGTWLHGKTAREWCHSDHCAIDEEHLAMNESKWAERLAENDGKEALASARATLVRALEELDLYSEKFDAAENPLRRAEILNWTLHYLSTGIAPNLRLDMLANAQARLTSLANH